MLLLCFSNKRTNTCASALVSGVGRKPNPRLYEKRNGNTGCHRSKRYQELSISDSAVNRSAHIIYTDNHDISRTNCKKYTVLLTGRDATFHLPVQLFLRRQPKHVENYAKINQNQELELCMISLIFRLVVINRVPTDSDY